MKKAITLAVVAAGALLAGSAVAAATPPTTAPPPSTAVDIPPVATFTGSGDDVVDLSAIDGPHVMEISYNGGSNFVVHTLDESFDTIDLAVNVIGSYHGRLMLNLRDDEHEVYAQVESSGAWTIDVLPFPAAGTMWEGGEAHGVGDDVVLFLGDPGIVEWAFVGDGNFAVIAYGGESRASDLLVNEIDTIDGTTVIRDSPVIVVVKADGGEWWLNLRP